METYSDKWAVLEIVCIMDTLYACLYGMVYFMRWRRLIMAFAVGEMRSNGVVVWVDYGDDTQLCVYDFWTAQITGNDFVNWKIRVENALSMYVENKLMTYKQKFKSIEKMTLKIETKYLT